MPANAIVSASFRCAAGDHVAATVSLVPPGLPDPRLATPAGDAPSRGVFNELWRLSIDGGPVPMIVGPVSEPTAVAAALADGDAAALAGVNLEYANFRCPECAACYCRAHWRDVFDVSDEGFYDATYGTCPRGHRVMLDD